MLELQINFAMMPFHKGKIILPKRPTGSLHGINEEDQSHRRILVVENDEDVAEMFAALLRMLEYHVQIVHRTGDAMRQISGRLPHAIFLDLNMPDLPAVDICRMLRHDLSTRHLPVFVLSENPEDERIQEALDVGADMFLSKPVGMDELVRALRHFVGKAKPDQNAGAEQE
jgi:DNA-binding response OmpR family regulator